MSLGIKVSDAGQYARLTALKIALRNNSMCAFMERVSKGKMAYLKRRVEILRRIRQTLECHLSKKAFPNECTAAKNEADL